MCEACVMLQNFSPFATNSGTTWGFADLRHADASTAHRLCHHAPSDASYSTDVPSASQPLTLLLQPARRVLE